MNLTLNQKIALGFLVLVLTYGSMGYISLQNLDKSRAITNKNLLINQPSIILLNEFKLLVVNAKNSSGIWVTIDIQNNPDKKLLKEIHDTAYPDLRKRLDDKVELWTDQADKDSIAVLFSEFEEILVQQKSIMDALPNIDAYQDFVMRVETEAIFENVEFESNEVLYHLEVMLQKFKVLASKQDREMLSSFESIRYSNIFLSIIAIVVGIVVTFYILRVVKLEEQKKSVIAERDAVQEQKDIIEEINAEVMASINYAKRIQSTILPSEETLTKQLSNHFVYYKPRDIVSGDFYWCVNFLEDEVAWLAAADCTGHGVPGAFVSFVCSKALHECVNDERIGNPASILDETTKLVEAAFEGGEADNVKDGMDIGLCRIDFKENKVDFAGAHNPMYLIRDGELMEFKGDRQPIGSHEDRKPYTNHSVDLKKGDTLYIFSDGFLDQFGGPKGKRYMTKRFREFLLTISKGEIKYQTEKIENELVSWQGEEAQVDDILIIGVRV
ncbi:MAG: SpoIIE family protein phosphatase [Flavobacteriales bacterium]|nr:SpoIIE family protein phosphatase [Flavobacteriales bacterium]